MGEHMLGPRLQLPYEKFICERSLKWMDDRNTYKGMVIKRGKEMMTEGE